MSTDLALLAYRNILTTNEAKMIAYIQEHHPWAPAEEMVTNLWSRLTSRLVEDYPHKGVDAAMADRIMNECLGFLYLCSLESGHGPSPLVDLGWHTFILYTVEYEAFCHALSGEMMHHLPTDLPSDEASKAAKPNTVLMDGLQQVADKAKVIAELRGLTKCNCAHQDEKNPCGVRGPQANIGDSCRAGQSSGMVGKHVSQTPLVTAGLCKGEGGEKLPPHSAADCRIGTVHDDKLAATTYCTKTCDCGGGNKNCKAIASLPAGCKQTTCSDVGDGGRLLAATAECHGDDSDGNCHVKAAATLDERPDGACRTKGKQHKKPLTLADTVKALAMLGPVDIGLWDGSAVEADCNSDGKGHCTKCVMAHAGRTLANCNAGGCGEGTGHDGSGCKGKLAARPDCSSDDSDGVLATALVKCKVCSACRGGGNCRKCISPPRTDSELVLAGVDCKSRCGETGPCHS